MDFKSLLQTMDTINEDSKVHKGTYGTSYGKEDVRDQYGHKIGKVNKDSETKKDEPKKGRGRPKKGAGTSGEDKSYDTSTLGSVFGGGKKPNKEVGKKTVKHSLKEYIEEAELSLNEDMASQDPIEIKPASQTNTQVIQQGNKTLGTVNNPQLAAQIKQSIGKGEMTLASDEQMSEDEFDSEHTGHDPAEYDMEGDFVKNQLHTISRATRDLEERISDQEDLPEWVEMKISQAQGMLASVSDYMDSQHERDVEHETGEEHVVSEKAKSKAQQKFFGMVHAMQKGKKVPGASKELKDVAKSIGKSDAKDFAKTKHKGLPQHVKKTNETSFEDQGVAEGSLQEYGDTAKGQKMLTRVQKRAVDRMTSKKADTDPKYARKNQQNANAAWERMTDKDVAEGEKPHPKELEMIGKTREMGVQNRARNADQRMAARAAQPKNFMQKVKQDIGGPLGKLAKGDFKGALGEEKDLPGKQDKLDVAKPKGKLDAKDFAALRSKKKVSESIVLEGVMKDLLINFYDTVTSHMGDGSIFDLKKATNVQQAEEVLKGLVKHSDEYDSLDSANQNELVNQTLKYLAHEKQLPFNTLGGIDKQRFATKPHADLSKFRQHPGAMPGSDFSKPGSPMATPRTTTGSNGFLKTLSTPTFNESNDMKDKQFESWERELNSLLNEGITVSHSTGQQGSPDSLSINATENDASELMSILRNSGMEMFGGSKEQAGGYGAPEHSGEEGGEEFHQGVEIAPSPEVVGDGDDMLALIKKMSGISSDVNTPGSVEVDYEDEEGSNEEGHDEACDDCGHSPCTCDNEDEGDEVDEAMYDEGNAFTGKLKQTPKGGEFKMGDKTYKDTSNIEEGQEECNECGYPMESCGCDHVEEGYANDAGGDAMEDAELLHLKELLGRGNDLHRQKHTQATGNIQKVTMETKLLKDSSALLTDWQKLSGIK